MNHNIQILTRVEGNIDFISPLWTKIFRRKHNQHLFCYMKKKTKPNKQDLKTDHPNFSVQYRIHEYNFARSLFLKYRRHQVVTVDLPTPIEIKPQIFYLIFL